jgi:DNA mismatch repair protein MSH6
MSGACPESYGLQVATMAGLPKSIVEKASVAGEMMRSKIARNFKSSEERVEFSTLHEEWFMAAIYVWCGGATR